jgi:hypothetical protein
VALRETAQGLSDLIHSRQSQLSLARVALLLLAFPAIFSLAQPLFIEKHEKQQKEENGMRGTVREDRLPAWMLQVLPWEALVLWYSP